MYVRGKPETRWCNRPKLGYGWGVAVRACTSCCPISLQPQDFCCAVQFLSRDIDYIRRRP